jgi:hypothetical protein
MLLSLLLRVAAAAPVPLSPEQPRTVSPSLQHHIEERYWYHLMQNMPDPSSLHSLKEVVAVIQKTISDSISDVDRDIATSKQIAHVSDIDKKRSNFQSS